MHSPFIYDYNKGSKPITQARVISNSLRITSSFIELRYSNNVLSNFTILTRVFLNKFFKQIEWYLNLECGFWNQSHSNIKK